MNLTGLIDYFVPVVGTLHHTLLPVEPMVNGTVQRVSPAHEVAVAGAVVLTILATIPAIGTGQGKTIQINRPISL